jgi:Peptidase M15
VSRCRIRACAVALLAVLAGGCGSSATHAVAGSHHHHAGPGPLPKAHPHAVQPVAGAGGSSTGGGAGGSGPAGDPATVGDPNAHAPSLKTVKRELVRLNLCGGATTAADAAPIVTGAGPGFVADPGTQQTEGRLPELTAELDALGKALGMTIYGISGYRSPAHSVAVGGFANDPHTRGEAEDIGVGSLLRSSAAQITESQLAQFHLYRPFDPSDDPGNTEVNHVQLIPHGGPLSLAAATSTYDPDPTCT